MSEKYSIEQKTVENILAFIRSGTGRGFVSVMDLLR